MSADAAHPSRVARVTHAAVALSAFSATVVLVALRVTGVVPAAPTAAVPTALLRGGTIALLAALTVTLTLVRAGIPPMHRDAEAWWAASLGRAVALWALADAAAVAGGVVYLLAADALVLALAVAWGAAMFVRYTPGRLTDG